MSILTFSASAVAAQIDHARSCTRFLPRWNGPVQEPALILVVGAGVYLRSNGVEDEALRIVSDDLIHPEPAFADGLNPRHDHGWAARRRATFRDLTGQLYLTALDDAQAEIDRGQPTVRLMTDGYSVQVFQRQAVDYVIGKAYEAPSGLGGVFRVILKEVRDSFAVVQNSGNCEDFDAMQPYRLPLDQLIAIEDREAA